MASVGDCMLSDSVCNFSILNSQEIAKSYLEVVIQDIGSQCWLCQLTVKIVVP